MSPHHQQPQQPSENASDPLVQYALYDGDDPMICFYPHHSLTVYLEIRNNGPPHHHSHWRVYTNMENKPTWAFILETDRHTVALLPEIQGFSPNRIPQSSENNNPTTPCFTLGDRTHSDEKNTTEHRTNDGSGTSVSMFVSEDTALRLHADLISDCPERPIHASLRRGVSIGPVHHRGDATVLEYLIKPYSNEDDDMR